MITERKDRLTKDMNTQWHPTFCSTMRLELREDLDMLECMNEYNLNSKPLQMDLLIIKKRKEAEIKNTIGKFFRKHNILEYKSPDDTLNLNSYIKVAGYACLYKAQESHVDEINLEDITITFVRERLPYKLFKWFRKNGFVILERYPGIYYIQKEVNFPIQMIISKKLSKKQQQWLTLLSRNLTQEEVERGVLQIQRLENPGERNHADSVLQVMIQENRDMFEIVKRKGDDNMCEALRELMEPEIREATEKARKEGLSEGRLFSLFDLVQKNILSKEIASKEAGVSLEDFLNIMQKYGYSV